ncbi:non-classical arabinogalactan protein 30 [Olea europaea var. sylvestris]|uniref:non-classical arabinogalactan protein 30 n=1 Tax=Olea europaea var. sylvestris TaxID=158386 RepID=UPI000C1D20F0|nr:non-classical arabinogalactan protein 30 [Olea europaea var. sylvestris]
MASSRLNSLVSFLVLSLAVSSTTAHENGTNTHKPVEKHVDVVVEGVVYCQSCDQYGTWPLTGAEPIESATVSIICKDHRNRVSFYKAFHTDNNGYFYAQLLGFKKSHALLDHPLHSCHVKLVSSPLENCNLLSNINYGLYGAPLRYEDKKLIGTNYEAVIYAAGPLAFRPAHCAPKEQP